MARVLITGATGFLGGALARHLRAGGHGVVASGRSRQALDRLANAGFAVLPLDLGDPLPDALPAPVDAVVHCAALSAPWGRQSAFERANVQGTRTALALAERLGARRFVNISSPSVYFALRDQQHIPEDHPLPRGFNAYARTKALAEELVLRRPDLGPINLRPRGIYGAGEQTLMPRLLAAARRGPLPLFRGGHAEIDLTHVSDVVRAIEAALHAGPEAEGASYNISGGEVLPIREIVAQVCKPLDVPLRWRPMPLRPMLALARLSEAFSLLRPGAHEPRVTPYALGLFAFRQSLDISRAARVLGWTPKMRFAQGLAQTLSKDIP